MTSLDITMGLQQVGGRWIDVFCFVFFHLQCILIKLRIVCSGCIQNYAGYPENFDISVNIFVVRTIEHVTSLTYKAVIHFARGKKWGSKVNSVCGTHATTTEIGFRILSPFKWDFSRKGNQVQGK